MKTATVLASVVGAAWFAFGAQARGRLSSGTVATGESDARVLTITGPPACR